MTEPIDSSAGARDASARASVEGTPRSDPGEHLLSLLLVGGSVIALATCASGTQPPVAPPPPPPAEVATEAPPAESEPLPPEGAPDPSVEPAPAQPVASGPLRPFWRQLAALEAGQRQEPVRVLWLGDSHTAADFMTDAVRREIQRRYGHGGPGFVRVGVPHYRHARARVELGGKWRRLPQQPSRRSTVSDGVFGLCGMRAVPEAKAFASVRVQASTFDADDSVRWALLVRLPGSSGLLVGAGGRSQRLTAPSGSAPEEPSSLGKLESVDGSSIQRFVFTTRAQDEVRIEHLAGSPEVFGVYIDGEAPGVVLDTCGVDGARIATVLAWEADTWQAEVRARAPDLAVLAYGTNEAFDDGSVQRYAGEYARVMERMRAAVPELPCWIVGPPDASDRAGRATVRVVEITELQRRAASDLGCGFVSARELMGGDGGFMAWRQASPPLARADGVHLSSEGYEKLGTDLATHLLPPGSAPNSGARLRDAGD